LTGQWEAQLKKKVDDAAKVSSRVKPLRERKNEREFRVLS